MQRELRIYDVSQREDPVKEAIRNLCITLADKLVRPKFSSVVLGAALMASSHPSVSQGGMYYLAFAAAYMMQGRENSPLYDLGGNMARLFP